MPAYKDNRQGTWYASFYFENWQGVKQKKLKRGFATKKDALAWEREGELLALTPADFDLDKGLLSITKSYQRLKGRDVITDPKTPKSVRVIQMPQFLTDEIRDYLKSLYKVQPDQRIFEVTKSYLHHEMDRGAKAAGVKRIRIHDLRHSHVSLLIEMGFSALAIADRVGHESVDITYKYAHLFPSKQQEMAQKLDMERKEG